MVCSAGRVVLWIALALTTIGAEFGTARAEPWTRSYINKLPDSAFAAIETTPDGKKVRHLPHHDHNGRVDLPHVRNGLSRLPQVKWIDPQRAGSAREHLRAHLQNELPMTPRAD